MENQTITWMLWGQPHFRSIKIHIYICIINMNVLFTMGYDWIQMILFLNQIYELYGSRVNMGYIYTYVYIYIIMIIIIIIIVIILIIRIIITILLIIKTIYIYILDCEWGSSTGNCEYGNPNES